MNLQELRTKYGQNMTEDQQAHIEGIIERLAERAYQKYAKGQAEHSGDLWSKPALIDEAMNEAIDQVIYIDTLGMQIDATGIPLGIQTAHDASMTPEP